MENPDKETDRVVCPDSRTKKRHTPEKVWNSPDGGPGKKPIRLGTLAKHKHGYAAPECPWSGLPVPVERAPGKKE